MPRKSRPTLSLQAQALKDARVRAGLTQHDLADLVQKRTGSVLSALTIKLYEKGRHEPSRKTIALLTAVPDLCLLNNNFTP